MASRVAGRIKNILAFSFNELQNTLDSLILIFMSVSNEGLASLDFATPPAEHEPTYKLHIVPPSPEDRAKDEGLHIIEPRPGISPEAIWKIDDAIFRQEKFWLTEVYSLAIHSQDLIVHGYALQARLQGKTVPAPIPRMNAFHNPGTITLNAGNILSKDGPILREGDSYWYDHSAWPVLVNTVASYNLRLADFVVEAQNQLGIKNFDRNAKMRTKIELSPEEELWLARAGPEELRKMAYEKDYDCASLRVRRSSLRHKFGLIGQIPLGQSWNNLSTA